MPAPYLSPPIGRPPRLPRRRAGPRRESAPQKGCRGLRNRGIALGITGLRPRIADAARNHGTGESGRPSRFRRNAERGRDPHLRGKGPQNTILIWKMRHIPD